MKRTGNILGFLFFFVLCPPAFAQSAIAFDSISDNVIFRKEWSGGVTFHSGGWGVTFHKGQYLDVERKRMWEADLVGMKTGKEVKSVIPYFSDARPFVYGKLNYLYILRAGYSFHNLLNRKPYWGGVELRYFYSAGISVGITRPVYLYIWYVDDTIGNYFTIKVKSEKYNPNKHDLGNIYGRGPYGDGFDQLEFHPGIYLKAGLNFDFGTFNRFVKCLEVGGILDYYPQAIQLMAFNPSKNLFPSIYLSFSLGKRGN
ncbi:MAG: hypothetical protein M0R21_03010 [Lentimicrobiaceae bacterium]|jgi:hypothetical protein|nr:hypothetical protein [Lentimicrobiaceae bacterium]